MTPQCQRCGSHVTERAIRVLYPEEVEQPEACVHCEDMTRLKGGKFREMRSTNK